MTPRTLALMLRIAKNVGRCEREMQLYWPAITTNNAQKGDAAAPAW
jgi:hypothetical protein